MFDREVVERNFPSDKAGVLTDEKREDSIL